MSLLGRLFPVLYGLISYAVFFGTFLYTAGFLTNLVVPKSIDSGETIHTGAAAAIDLGLLALFAIQHSGMARPGWKRMLTRVVPQPMERATYVLLSSVVMMVMMACWQPIDGAIWHFDEGAGLWLGYGTFAAGLGLVLYSTMLIDHFELFGLRQVWDSLRQSPPRKDDFVTPSLYRYVRHPLYVGWFVTLWATPSMTTGHLLFASVCTAYVLVAVQLEENDLVAAFGDRYRAYRRTTPMFVPRPRSVEDGSPSTAFVFRAQTSAE